MKDKIEGSTGTFKPSPPKEGRSRDIRRLMKSLSGIRLQEFLEWGPTTLPSKNSRGQHGDPYKKKYKARRKIRMKMARRSRRINRKRR